MEIGRPCSRQEAWAGRRAQPPGGSRERRSEEHTGQASAAALTKDRKLGDFSITDVSSCSSGHLILTWVAKVKGRTGGWLLLESPGDNRPFPVS